MNKSNIDPIMQFICDDNPVNIILLQGGPFNGIKVVMAVDGDYMVFNYLEKNINIPFIAEYKKIGIYDLGVWEYEFTGTYRADSIDEEDEDDEW